MRYDPLNFYPRYYLINDRLIVRDMHNAATGERADRHFFAPLNPYNGFVVAGEGIDHEFRLAAENKTAHEITHSTFTELRQNLQAVENSEDRIGIMQKILNWDPVRMLKEAIDLEKLHTTRRNVGLVPTVYNRYPATDPA